MYEEFLIPKNVKTRFTFFTDFGFKELFILLAGLIAGVILSVILFLVLHSIFCFLPTPFGVVIGFFLGKFDPRIKKNAIELYRDFRNYHSKPKRYLYRYGDGRK